MGIASSLPIDPPVNRWAYPRRTDHGLRAPDPLTIIPPSNGGTSSHSAERANHFVSDRLGDLPVSGTRAQWSSERLRLSHLRETQTSKRRPPRTHSTGLRGGGRVVRPPAKDRIQGKRSAKQKRQAVSANDPQAEAIVDALSQEMGCCEAQGLECGPCFMRRVGELGIERGIPGCAKHECLLIPMAIDPRSRRSRSIAYPLKRRIKDLVESHLRWVPPGSLRFPQRTKDPRGWVRTRLVSDPNIILFTRKEG